MQLPRFFRLSLLLVTGVFVSVARAQSNYATPYTFSTMGPAAFNSPTGLVVDSGGFVFVADTNNNQIKLITPQGEVITIAGSGVAGSANGVGMAAQFNRPSGVAVDSANNVFVADTNNHVIRKIALDSTVTTFAGTMGSSGYLDANGTSARFNRPTGIAIDGANNIYVADTTNHSIRKITPAGDVTTLAGGGPTASGWVEAQGTAARLNTPRGVAVDGAGNVYVADLLNHAIRKINPNRDVTTLAGGGPSASGSTDGTGTAARFFQPFGVGVDATGNVYVADTLNEVVRKISPGGVVTTLGGVAGAPGTVNGTGAAARFNSPYGVSVEASGTTIYVIEAGGNVVRKGTPPAGGAVAGAKIPGITVPLVVPAGASVVEARALADQAGGGVIVAVSGAYAVRPTGGGGAGRSAQAALTPDYTNPQPYNLSYVVRLLANGQPDPAFTSAPGGDGTVNAIAVQADAKIVVGGTFTTFNGVLFRNLARLNPDGKSDPTFVLGSGVDAQVNAIAIQADGRILVGGAFQNFQGLARPYLLRLNSNGAIDATFSPGLNGTVNSIAVQSDGRIVVGGAFTTVGGTARNRIARLVATGALDAGFDPGAGANDEVVTLALQADGKILAGGDFTSFAGQSRTRVVRLLTTGAVDPAFSTTAAANATVLSVAVQSDGSLMIGGSFTLMNGVARVRLARLNADGTLDASFDPGTGANKDVRTLLPRSDGTLFLGGLFDQYQSAPANEIVAVAGVAVSTAFTRAPAAFTVNAGGTARFVSEATGTGALSYQWFKDGVAIAGATESTLTLTNASAANQGSYTLQVTSSTGSVVTSSGAALTVVGGLASQIINLSVLTSLDTPTETFTLGFVLGGAGTSGAKPLLVRAGGPSLAAFGVGAPLADPKLQFFAGQTLAGENNDWGGGTALSTLMTQVGAYAYTNAASKDAAFAPTQTAASNSVIVSGSGGTGGVIAEVYDATPVSTNTATTPRLLNVSVLKTIPAGAVLTAGFVIRGNTTKTILLRAVGPTLSTFNVGGPMADPKLTVYRGDGTVVATNDNWNGTAALKSAFGLVGAFGLDGTTKDAALLLNLAPGSYTAEATSTNPAAGAAIVEVYEVP